MADRLCDLCMGCCSCICAVVCRDVSLRTSYVIQFVIYGLFQGYNIASDIGMFVDVFNAVRRCNDLVVNQTEPRSEKTRIFCRRPGNFTAADLDREITTLEVLQWFFLLFAAIGVAFYIAHLCTLVPNICKHFRDPMFENDMDSPNTPNYYRNIIIIHSVFMWIETFIHDIPASCLAMELSVHYFGPAEINCWECAVIASSVPGELSLKRGSLWIGLKVSAVALISIYKGILPLYFWLGNPFCWSCYPLRFLIAAPAGLGFMVMILTPCMGVAQYRVLKKAPALESAVGTASGTIWTIGLVFWILVIMMFLFYKIFRNFLFELCPCLAWCEDDDSTKKKKKEEKGKKTTGCLCF